MDGTTFQRVLRVWGNLAHHPTLVPRYLRTGIGGHRTPLELSLPWISWKAIDALDAILKPGMRAFEYGTGGSTVFLAKRCAHVRSVEENEEWFAKTRQALGIAELDNVEAVFADADFSSPEAYMASPFFLTLTEEPSYDVIFIDGQDNVGVFRPLCFERAEKAIRPGGIIVVDDAWRYPELASKSHAKQHREFRSVGPARLGVTQTDIYQY